MHFRLIHISICCFHFDFYFCTVDYSNNYFVPVAIETTGVFGPEALQFLRELGHRLKSESGEAQSFYFLQQRISVAIQRGNAAAVLGTMKSNNNDYNIDFIS